MAVSILIKRLLLSSAAKRRKILLDAETRIEALWRVTNPHSGLAVQQFTERAAAISVAAQRQAVALTTASQFRYMDELGIALDFATDVPDDPRLFGDDHLESDFAKPVEVRVQGKRQSRLPTQEVFNRPAREYRQKVANGVPEVQALEESVIRAKLSVETNIQLAEREARFQVLDEAARTTPKFLGYRRVIHPEASDSGVCGLCVAASDRIYSRENLQPIHNRCQCEVLPVTDDNDPGGDLNAIDLRNLYDLAGGTAGDKLKKLRFQEDEHGELGPVLRPVKGDSVEHFHNPEVSAPVETVDLDESEKDREVAQRLLPTMEQSLKALITGGSSEDSSQVQYHRRQVERYRLALSQ